MSHWNNRIVKSSIDGSLGIHEVYYDDDGKINMYSSEPSVIGNDLEDLKGALEKIHLALATPILNEEDMPGYRA